MAPIHPSCRNHQHHRSSAVAMLSTVFIIASAASPSLALSVVHPRRSNHHHHARTRTSSLQWHPSVSTLHKLSLAPHGNNSSRGMQIMSMSSSQNDEASSSPASATASRVPNRKRHKHTLAILTMPHSASARIANEAILETAISVTSEKLSVVLRTNTGGSTSKTGEADSNEMVSLTQLRRYAGEVYSMAWDAAFGLDERENTKANNDAGGGSTITTGGKLLDLIVYPQNLPNTPPEGWIELRPDLSCICSHDSITGWITSDLNAGGSGRAYATQEGQGLGGLREHVLAVNAERQIKGLKPLEALHVDDWPDGAEVTDDPNVVFLEDEDAFDKIRLRSNDDASNNNGSRSSRDSSSSRSGDTNGLIGPGGTSILPSSLYSSVCVGGTFDGMHYGHRKLLTLAISSVQPMNGRLLIGVTRDEMLTKKAFAECIPPLEERIAGVLDFIGNLAPGMKNRIRCVPINDEYGPPGQPMANDFDALVLSHETLPTGRKLNNYREKVLGLAPLKLLCTQRTEPHGMSSTALRRMRTSIK